MGAKTWVSLPKRPLPNRINIVITTQCVDDKIPIRAKDFDEALYLASEIVRTSSTPRRIFVIGGARVYACALKHALCKNIILSQILNDIECDTFMPPVCRKTFEIQSVGETIKGNAENDIVYQIITYRRKSEECQYLDLVRDTLDTGTLKPNRTGVDTFAQFGCVMRFSLLNDTIPLFTTKKVFWKGIVEELLWFIRGSPDITQLPVFVKIWDEDVERNGGDPGPIYPFQWRHFGATYVKGKTDYTGEGKDQLQNIVDTIKANPNDRRLIMCSWNAMQISEMCLPPCHVLAQFFVHGKYLSCAMYQRSADLAIGIPFNVASYSLLTHLIANHCGLTAYEFVHFFGDTHVYKNHVESLKEQLLRAPKQFPTLRFKAGSESKRLEEVVADDIQLENYLPHGAIKMMLNTGLNQETQAKKAKTEIS